MALLDDLRFARSPQGPFNGMYPSPLQPDTYVDLINGGVIEMPKAKASFGPVPNIGGAPADGYGAGALPFSFAGPGSMDVDPSKLAGQPTPQATTPAPSPAPVVAAPKPAPTDVSANRAPLSLAPALPSQAPVTVEQPGFMDRLSNGLAANPMTLMTLGAGIAQGGVGKGLQYAAAGSQADRTNRQKQLTQTATYAALKARGMSDADALLAMQSPEALKAVLPRLFPSYKSTTVGNTAAAFNEADGTFKPGFTAPKFERLGPGETLIQTPGGAMGSTDSGGQPSVIARGGPEKAPQGYQWVDPNDQSKGVTAIPGGPGTHLPSETAGRVAMMETAAADLPNARRILMEGRGSTGTGVSGATANALNIGDTGRANRTVTVAIEGALRAMTGAAAPDTEVRRYENMFMPSPFDSRETATQKLNQLDNFIANARRLVTQGRNPGGDMPAGRASDPLGVR